MPKDRRPYAHNSTMRVAKAPLRKVNEERRARREEADLVYGTHHHWIMTQRCDREGDAKHGRCESYDGRAPIEGHHLRSVGSGGQDRNNEIPCCNKLHDEFERTPLSEMCRRYHADFKSRACDYTEQFDMENG